ncbi:MULTISPECIES: TniB family NTP-binding protein [Pseudomonas]|uniref:TniB family NTP-binding protein n=1 Tax=Pseudomonas TaxID=286 RepID=UPI00191BBED3|nr:MULTISPECIES: TniB family NTP-binding protein [Pseudomonas]MCM3892938.1 TniB family NTP-binding protein [Pseudomonas aeruginosa]MCM3943842.1 TniB family NTP-binding protein [Pseudomonas aeruginosa]MCM3955847.1 TniB family NTP-binding protein [Pseudomonas aeruginosa]MCM3961890.1 TniB family NTP-binding protein [Pseudomonas aeruginosa]MCM3967982.1 TniB family NTP-binding protein [Pseudomonas aeruginosa]
MTDYAHLHADFRPVLHLSDRERILFMGEPRWIAYKSAVKILDTLGSLLDAPKRPRMPNLLLVGDSNNGKTTLIHQFVKTHGQGYVNEESEPVRPIILAESPPSADEKELYVAILEQMWMPYRSTDPKIKLRYQVIHSLRELKVRMLIIDEIHSMLTGSAIKQREVMNALKLLCNTLMIPIVGVGTPDAVQILHIDPQHASRFDTVKLETWKLDADFQRLLKAFELVLPLKKPSKLFEPQLAQLLHSISGGNTGDLHGLLVECAKEAITSGKECIDRQLIESKSWKRPTRGIRELIV